MAVADVVSGERGHVLVGGKLREGGLEPEAELPVVLPLANLRKEWHKLGGSKTCGKMVLLGTLAS